MVYVGCGRSFRQNLEELLPLIGLISLKQDPNVYLCS